MCVTHLQYYVVLYKFHIYMTLMWHSSCIFKWL